MSTNNALYQALRSGPASAAQIRKATKLPDEEVEAALEEWKSRQWLDTDESGRTTKFSLSEHGRAQMAGRYPDG